MKFSTKFWLITATLLVIFGSIITFGALLYSGGNFDKISSTKYQTNTFNISESFNSISVDLSTADLEFVVSETNECKVESFEQQNLTHSAAVLNGVLNIGNTDNRTWRDHFGFNFKSSKVKVYLPSGEYQNVTINSSTGEVNICQGFTFNSLKITLTTGDVKVKDATVNEELFISVTTGDIEIKSVTAKKITSKGSTGETYLNGVVAVEHITIERTTGDVEFSGIDAHELFFKTTTGDIEGSILSEKKFDAKTSTGKKVVPNTTNGGDCVLQTSTGDIRVSIKNA